MFLRYEETASEDDKKKEGESPKKKEAASKAAAVKAPSAKKKKVVKKDGDAYKKDIKKEPTIEKKKEISGYIDLAQRFQTEDFRPYFLSTKFLLPHNGDLSYFNWKTQNPTASDSRNFRVVTNSKAGLLFRNKLDRKDIDVNPALVLNNVIT